MAEIKLGRESQVKSRPAGILKATAGDAAGKKMQAGLQPFCLRESFICHEVSALATLGSKHRN